MLADLFHSNCATSYSGLAVLWAKSHILLPYIDTYWKVLELYISYFIIWAVVNFASVKKNVEDKILTANFNFLKEKKSIIYSKHFNCNGFFRKLYISRSLPREYFWWELIYPMTSATELLFIWGMIMKLIKQLCPVFELHAASYTRLNTLGHMTWKITWFCESMHTNESEKWPNY